MFLKIVQSKIINIYIITFVHYIQFNVKFNVKITNLLTVISQHTCEFFFFFDKEC